MNSKAFSMKIKICGLTNVEQALECVKLGANWIGLNCWSGSSRYISPELVRDITSALPQSVTKVGVFVNETIENLHEIMSTTGLDFAQLHGDETVEYTAQLQIPWFKAFRISPDFELNQIDEFQQEFFLMDAYSKTNYGGTGETIDWDLAQKAAEKGKFILAGGLQPDNVAQAIQKVRPWGVDVCSGVESSPGIKDMKKVKTFINHIIHSQNTKPNC